MKAQQVEKKNKSDANSAEKTSDHPKGEYNPLPQMITNCFQLKQRSMEASVIERKKHLENIFIRFNSGFNPQCFDDFGR